MGWEEKKKREISNFPEGILTILGQMIEKHKPLILSLSENSYAPESEFFS